MDNLIMFTELLGNVACLALAIYGLRYIHVFVKRLFESRGGDEHDGDI